MADAKESQEPFYCPICYEEFEQKDYLQAAKSSHQVKGDIES